MGSVRALNPGRNAPPANAAVIDVHALRAIVLMLLKDKVAETKANPRYRDDSYLDDDGVHHALGGVWNDTSGRAAIGFTKDDVREVREQLREHGLLMEFVAVDALLSEYICSGTFNVAIRMPGDSEPMPQRRKTVDIKDLGRDRYDVDGEVVTFRDRHVTCRCRDRRCDHEVAARRRRTAWSPSPEKFVVSDRRKQELVRNIVRLLQPLADSQVTQIGRTPYTTKQRVIALVIRALFKDKEFEEGAAASLCCSSRARVADCPIDTA
ncbi:MAG: hypothetical protein ACYDA5_04000 [Vulcanimicrobiaceae bacterium]